MPLHDPLLITLSLPGTALTSQLSPTDSCTGNPFQRVMRWPPHTTVCRFGSKSSGYMSVVLFAITAQRYNFHASKDIRRARKITKVTRMRVHSNKKRIFAFGPTGGTSKMQATDRQTEPSNSQQPKQKNKQ